MNGMCKRKKLDFLFIDLQCGGATTYRESLTTCYMSAIAEKQGYSNQIEVISDEHIEEGAIIHALADADYRYIVIDFEPHQIHVAKRLSHIFMKAKKGQLVLCGVFASIIYDDLAESGFLFDYVFVGHPEFVLMEFIKRIKEKNLPKCGKIFTNVNDINSLPNPNRKDIKNRVELGVPIAICGSKGCLHRCSFCLSCCFYSGDVTNRRIERDSNSVVEEICFLHNKYGVKKFDFVDEDFLGSTKAGKERAVDIAARIYERIGDGDLQFSFDTRIENINECVIKKWKAIGLKYVMLGIESVNMSDQILYNKIISKDLIREKIKLLDSYGIDYKLGTILWNPFSNAEKVLENLRFLLSLGYIDQQPLRKVNLYKGTELYKKCKDDIKDEPLSLKWEFKEKRLNGVYNNLFQAIKYSVIVLNNESLSKYHRKIHILNLKIIMQVLEAHINGEDYSKYLSEYINEIESVVLAGEVNGVYE